MKKYSLCPVEYIHHRIQQGLSAKVVIMVTCVSVHLQGPNINAGDWYSTLSASGLWESFVMTWLPVSVNTFPGPSS